MKAKAADFLVYDEVNQVYRENPEQAVRDDVEKHYWLHVQGPWPRTGGCM